MLGIIFSPQNYHHHQQFLSKLREINENVMTSAVWAVIVFGPLRPTWVIKMTLETNVITKILCKI